MRRGSHFVRILAFIKSLMCVEGHRNLGGGGRAVETEVPRSKPRPALTAAPASVTAKPATLALASTPEVSFQEKCGPRIQAVRAALSELGVVLDRGVQESLKRDLDLLEVVVACEDESTLSGIEVRIKDIRKKVKAIAEQAAAEKAAAEEAEATRLAAERAAAEEARKAAAEKARLEAARLTAEKAATERAAAPSVETLSAGTTITVTINEDQFKKARQQNKGGEVAVTGGHQVKLELPSKKELKVTLVRANPSKPLNEQGLRDAVLAWLSK